MNYDTDHKFTKLPRWHVAARCTWTACVEKTLAEPHEINTSNTRHASSPSHLSKGFGSLRFALVPELCKNGESQPLACCT